MPTTRSILNWRDYVPQATVVCKDKFGDILEEYGLTELSPEDTYARICNRYCGYIKTIHIKRPEYFTDMWMLHGLAQQFSKLELGVKWFIPLMQSRLSNAQKSLLTDEVAEDLIRWAATRYNFWLGKQLYG